MSAEAPVSTAGDLAGALRRHDRDRYLTTLFAPADRRRDLVALYSFNFEVAKTREVVREAMLGRVRLQWWREAVAEIYAGGTVRRHENVEPLAVAIRRHRLPREELDRLIDAREADLEEAPPADLVALERYAEDSSGSLVGLALRILGVADAAALAVGVEVGIAWGLVGAVRALPVHAAAHRATLPVELTAAHGLDERDYFELRPSPALTAVAARLAEAARRHLDEARRQRRAVPRRARSALLPATIAETHLRRLARAGCDPFAASLREPDPLLAWRLAAAALAGRF